MMDKKIKLLFLYKLITGENVWLVSGENVRYIYDTNYTEGGHDVIYRYIPENEIWIDDEVRGHERPLIVLHEYTERRLMLQGFKYSKAHQIASIVETYARHHMKQ